MNTYLLNYDVFETKISANQLESFIKESRKIIQWHRPFFGTYIIKSSEPLQTLTESLRGAFDGATFILTLAYPTLMGGALSPTVWGWINGNPFAALLPNSAQNEK